MLKASLEVYGLTADCPAMFLTDYGKAQESVTLPVGTIFVVEADARPVARHPDKVFNRIVAGGEHYLVEANILAKNSTKMRPEEES